VLSPSISSVVKFDTTGLDFAMTALFLVILTSQLKTFTTKYPFIIGAGTALFALMLFGKGNILLGGAIMTVILLVVLRERIEKDDNR
jgi:4-azaleucine resistance transporter AzlC